MAIQLGILDRLESLDKLTWLGDPLATLAKVVPFTLFREDLPTREPSPKGGRPPIDGLLLLMRNSGCATADTHESNFPAAF